MKRWISVILAVCVMLGCSVGASAESAFVLVTDAVYANILVGGVDNTLLYTMYDQSGSFLIGTLTADGEQTREPYSAARWDELVEDDPWKTTVHGDAGALCPYAHTHGDTTVCPYLEIDLVTVTNTVTGVTLENYYVPTAAVTVFPSGGAHICWGRYGFEAPITLKWDGHNRYFALKNDEGLWGVFDAVTDTMVTAYTYDTISTVHGKYAKVYNGTAWGRLDLSGATETVYCYAEESDFSVTEELRQLSDTSCQVYNADNEPISAVYSSDGVTLSYSAESHLLLVTAADGASTLVDLNGQTIASFSADETVTHLQDACYAVKTADGVALGAVEGAVQPDDTVTEGDVNFDTLINSRDVRATLLGVAQAKMLTARQTVAADMNDDGVIDTSDARQILQQILKND